MDNTLPLLVFSQAKRFGKKTAMRRKEEGVYRDLSWTTLADQIRLFARGLMALGLKKGERAAIMSPNCPEWVFADLGTMACEGLSVPVYYTEGPEAVLHILRDSGSRFLFLSSPLLLDDLLPETGKDSGLEKIILLTGSYDHPEVISMTEFLQGAEKVPESELEKRIAAGKEEDVATLVYTSGTTGEPKGVMLTHRNILSNIDSCAELFDIGPDDECLSFLPLSHVFERVDGYYFMLSRGVVISYAESIDSVPVNLQEVKPTVMISVPRLYEKMYARVLERVLSGPWLKKQLFFGAVKAGRAHVRKEMAGENPGLLLNTAVALAKKEVFSKLKERLGGRLRFFISGGAPLGRDIAEFFMAADIPIYEGYGLTESAGGISVNTPNARKLGTVGRPFSNTQARIGEDGEILLKGEGIFKGYWQRPEETREAFEDGWFRTGDVGEIDEQGFLAITDRKKDLIVTAGGENIAPQFLENLFKRDKFLSNAMVYGDRKPYLTALLVPNMENLEKFARENNLDFLNHCDLVNHPKILELIRGRIDSLQEKLPSIQRIKRFTLLSQDFSKTEVTPTLKLKRKLVTDHFKNVLEGMYLAEDHGIHDSGFCIIEGES